jgi:glycyl-tRNA synthetase beta chain
MEATLLVELLTEELPPKALHALSQTFASGLLKQLEADGFVAKGAVAKPFATPRRLAVQIPAVLDRAPDRPLEFLGPPVTAGEKAVAGFAKKNGVQVENLIQVESPKGKVFAYRTIGKGGLLASGLDLKVEESLKKLPIPKVMRWGDGDAQFVRPVHGLVMLHGERVIPGRVLGLDSRNVTLGHRSLSTGKIEIPAADQYEALLEQQGRVIASFDARRARIRAALEAAADNAKPLWDDALLDEVTALVEYPVAFQGTFSPEFLSVPQECLILSMKQHQKYFPLAGSDGKLLPKFLVVSNLETRDPANIIHGNERVLRARLADAKFFYDQDRKTRLEERVPQLAKVVYHNKLGSQLERVERVQLLAGKIARMLGADVALAERAAWLAKADLLTGMVGEFPELQGTVGRYYALHDGEPKEVADAIEQHYWPRFAGDRLPEERIACAVALSDKLDTLVGMFGVGQKPTGDKDPFALRRQALGIIHILIDRSLGVSLGELIRLAERGFGGLGGEEYESLSTFFFDRLSVLLKDRNYTTQEIDAVLGHVLMQHLIYREPLPTLQSVLKRLEAVRSFSSLPEAAALSAANKRTINILRKEGVTGVRLASKELLAENAEKKLAQVIVSIRSTVDAHYDRQEYVDCLKILANLKNPVDAFFDQVLVNAADAAIRNNRLAILSELGYLLNKVADISKLAA